MNTVSLHANGTILAPHAVTEHEVLRYLGARVELSEEYTLGTLFRMLGRYPLLTSLSEFLPGLQERTSGRLPKTEPPAGLSHLTFTKTIEMVGYPGKPRMEMYTSLQGFYYEERVDCKNFKLESLLGAPLRLGPLQHIVFGDSVDVLEFTTSVTLFELIDGIVWDLSFHVTPQECQIVR